MSSFRLLVLLALVSACSSKQPDVTTTSTETHDSARVVASMGQGIPYPSSATFRMSELRGKTYKYVVKEVIKPQLDKLADAKNGGQGFANIGSDAYRKNSQHLDPKTHAKYKGAKWNRNSRKYEGAMSEDKVELAYETLKKVKPRSNSYSLQYFEREDKSWATKNDMAVALKSAGINAAPFDLATMYALTGGIGVKVKIDDNNYNYHVLYKTGRTNPHQEVMSGRSFSSSPGRGVADATDPEYLRDLQEYLKDTQDERPFYRALILAIANTDPSGFAKLSNLGQAVLADFLTVYTAEAVRHQMVDLKDGQHPWEIDLAAVTVVSSLSVEIGKIVAGGQLVADDIGGWFAPSPNNKPGGPQRSGIGITRRDRVKFTKAIHAFELGTPDGRELIKKIQAIIGTQQNGDDVIQGVFEFLSNRNTPNTLGSNATKLADLVAEFVEVARHDADDIAKTIR